MRDAFLMGWHDCALHKNKTKDHAERHFEAWYRESVNTGSRVDVAATWIDEYPAIVGMDFAKVDYSDIEARLLSNMSPALIAQLEKGEYPPFSPMERDREINKSLGYPLYQEGQPLAPKKHTVREFGESGGAGGTEHRFANPAHIQREIQKQVYDTPAPKYAEFLETGTDAPVANRKTRRKGKRK